MMMIIDDGVIVMHVVMMINYYRLRIDVNENIGYMML